jgi:hypothetical protein
VCPNFYKDCPHCNRKYSGSFFKSSLITILFVNCDIFPTFSTLTDRFSTKLENCWKSLELVTLGSSNSCSLILHNFFSASFVSRIIFKPILAGHDKHLRRRSIFSLSENPQSKFVLVNVVMKVGLSLTSPENLEIPFQAVVWLRILTYHYASNHQCSSDFLAHQTYCRCCCAANYSLSNYYSMKYRLLLL